MTKFYNDVLEVLKQDERFFTEDGTLLRNAVYEAAMQMDSNLIHLLLSNKSTKEHFFKSVDGIIVFDKIEFGWVVNNKEFLPDSYTRFKNKIGLSDENGNMFSQSGHVELVFPYKDCILEGGQTKDDQKRSEVFYNESLAPDEVDRLLYPKVLTEAKRYTRDCKTSVTDFNDKDNLIIKGNNLLALSSLLKKYEGKIDLIYIDPPFNTGKDDFKYNDNFNHSTWLSFMKTRLILAKRLLADTGNIFVHLDFHESHYAKILMDEIFGMDNFRNNIVWCYTGPSGSNNFLPRKHDDILYYCKSTNNKYNVQYIEHKSGVHNSGQVFGSTDVDEDFKEQAESKGKKLEDFWTDIYSTDRYRSEMLGFAGQKPEALIERIINIATDEGDTVLDFFLGSGTTAVVSHKMNRKYIGVEQIESQVEIVCDRLLNVIKGDKIGISNKVNWQGGGSFVYCELAKANQNFVDEIQSASSLDEIKDIYTRIIKTGFISSKVNPKEIDANVDEFDALTFDDQKRFLMELLDKNLLYVNYCDIDDEEFSISDEDKAFTKSFYGEV